MNTTVNADPMDDGYWATFERRQRQVISDRNRRAGRYGGTDPATWGWRRPNPAELRAECIARLERAASENGVRE